MLDVGDGNQVYWEECGNPRGKPALVLHGGPGSGCTPASRRFFDPARYRVILFDQRGCGRSTPHASEPDVDLAANTTWHLIGDMELLRAMLGIDRWQLFGASWGSALAITYAVRHPDRVSELVLAGVSLGRRTETDLLIRGLGPLFPDAWERFRAGVPESSRDGDLAGAYHRLLFDPDPDVRAKAAKDWCDWETAVGGAVSPQWRSPGRGADSGAGVPQDTVPTSPRNPRYADPRFRLAFARIVTHYFGNGSWLEEDMALRHAERLAGIPGVVIQGRLDLSNLSGTPWQLVAAWPEAELVLIDDTGHGGSAELAAARVAATDRFAGAVPVAGQ
ncbi:alpha/beta fold hydrolase [Amycolatopsis samaneae]|uniref:Proline iminopeptidase n=1 Tax=Amycolatopsis samaneae TaxID=664691 RepID=A0ABW5GLM5_9PSEU